MAKKVLYVSAYNLHDTSSGAALQMKTMLESLVRRGIEVKVVGSFIFDHPRGAGFFPNLDEDIKNLQGKPAAFVENGIEYRYTPCASRYIGQMTHDETWNMFHIYCGMVNFFRPDIVMGYGMGTLGLAVHSDCNRRGIPFVYPICNANHGHYTFEDCDLIFTESAATAQMYAHRDRVNLAHTGIFIDKEKYIAKEHKPEYITIVNPEASKGGGIFAKLALVCQKELPKVKFLAVDGRGSFAETIQTLHEPNNKDKKPLNHKMFKNVDIAGHTGNMKEIYARTKILLAPSLFYESWGRVATEAVLNNIPCIITNNGGLPEAIAGAGIILDPPSECLKDYTRIPTDEEIRPWVEALKTALKKDFKKELKAAQEQLDIERSTDRVLEILEPLFAKKASNNPCVISRGLLRMEVDGGYK